MPIVVWLVGDWLVAPPRGMRGVKEAFGGGGFEGPAVESEDWKVRGEEGEGEGER